MVDEGKIQFLLNHTGHAAIENILTIDESKSLETVFSIENSVSHCF